MMISLALRQEQNIRIRQSLIQALGLESKFLQSCLVRSEALLQQSKYQKGLRLVRHFADEVEYRSVMDFLVAIFIPSLKDAIFAYYKGRGERLIAIATPETIERVDKTLARCIVELEQLDRELRGWGRKERREMTEGWSDLVARPKFPALDGSPE